MNNKKVSKYLERYLNEISKKKCDDKGDEVKRVRKGDNIKRMVEMYERPKVGKLTKARTISVGPIYIPTNVITCLDDIFRKESEKYRRK